MELNQVSNMYPVMFKEVITRLLQDYYSSAQAAQIIQDAEQEYELILKRTPDMGGLENAYISNIYFGAYFIALYQQVRRELSLDTFGKIIPKSIAENDTLRNMMANQDPFSEKAQEKRAAAAAWAKKNQSKYPWTWQVRFSAEKKEGVYYEFTECGLIHLCRAEKVPELTPLLCAADYAMASMSNCKLTRTKTLAQGGDCCDFWLLP